MSNDAPNPPVTGTMTFLPETNTKIIVEVRRKRKTADAMFGEIWIGSKFICYSMENLLTLILPGSYNTRIDMSPHLGYRCPHLQVPERDLAVGGDAGLRVHVANLPSQIKGCVAVGEKIDGASLDHSQAAFDTFMSYLPQSDLFQVSISSEVI